MKGYDLIANSQLAIFFLQNLSQQIQSGLVPLSNMETIFIQYIREFPGQEQLKIFDLFSRFSLAMRHTREIYFSFQWLLEAETEHGPMIDADLDVLKRVRFS
jgi:hypothetical protein